MYTNVNHIIVVLLPVKNAPFSVSRSIGTLEVRPPSLLRRSEVPIGATLLTRWPRVTPTGKQKPEDDGPPMVSSFETWDDWRQTSQTSYLAGRALFGRLFFSLASSF